MTLLVLEILMGFVAVFKLYVLKLFWKTQNFSTKIFSLSKANLSIEKQL